MSSDEELRKTAEAVVEAIAKEQVFRATGSYSIRGMVQLEEATLAAYTAFEEAAQASVVLALLDRAQAAEAEVATVNEACAHAEADAREALAEVARLRERLAVWEHAGFCACAACVRRRLEQPVPVVPPRCGCGGWDNPLAIPSICGNYQPVSLFGFCATCEHAKVCHTKAAPSDPPPAEVCPACGNPKPIDGYLTHDGCGSNRAPAVSDDEALALVRDLAENGLRFDLHPCISWKTEDDIHRFYLDYLKRIDDSVAERARVALAAIARGAR